LTKLPEPVRDLNSPLFMYIVRTFDINKPGTKIKDLKGGIFGGSIIKGTVKIDMEIEIRPGIIFKDMTFKPIYTKISNIKYPIRK